MILTALENPVVRLTHMVTTNYFDLLGVQPYRGRAFFPGDSDESVAILLGAFAILALALGGAGIYGVISFSVTRRMPEFTVRLAIGASRRDIHRLVVGDGLFLTLIGILIGVGTSLALMRLISMEIYGVANSDPLTFGMAALVVPAVTVAACLLPALRATRIEPAKTLNAE